jgi:hypothetical protein
MIEQEQNERDVSQYHLEYWQPTDTAAIYQLEKACWAPWLRKTEQHIATIAENFPETQLLLRNQGGDVAAIMTATRVNWDGNPASLTTWDAVAGGSIAASDYVTTYTPDGNTLCLISSAIDPNIQGKRLAPQLVEGMGDLARKLGAAHLIGPFRPNGYGDFKLEYGPVAFAEYCAMTRENGQPIDPWLRSAFRLGMQPLRIEEYSMVVEVPVSTFEEYQKTYHPQKWQEVAAGVWECGETGSWFVSGDQAVYIEPNLWGELPI